MLRYDEEIARRAHTRIVFDISNGNWCCRSTLSNVSLEQHFPKRFTIECHWGLNTKLVVHRKWIPIQNQFIFYSLSSMHIKSTSQNLIYAMELDSRIWLRHSDSSWGFIFTMILQKKSLEQRKLRGSNSFQMSSHEVKIK